MSALFNKLMLFDNGNTSDDIRALMKEAAMELASLEADVIKKSSLLEHKDSVLTEAALKFAQYEVSHRAKAEALSKTEDKVAAHESTTKADTNRDYAKLCRDAAAEA